jgi:hypothetical protein
MRFLRVVTHCTRIEKNRKPEHRRRIKYFDYLINIADHANSFRHMYRRDQLDLVDNFTSRRAYQKAKGKRMAENPTS